MTQNPGTIQKLYRGLSMHLFIKRLQNNYDEKACNTIAEAQQILEKWICRTTITSFTDGQ
jgi:hypothetical protein